MKPDEIREQITVVESFLDHRGWIGRMVDKLVRRQAAAMEELLADVGNTKAGRTDFLRGKIDAYQDVLKMPRADLMALKAELEEAMAEPAPESDDSVGSLPPV